MTDASSQTEKTATKNSATTAKPHTASASTGPAPPTCKTVKTQTEDLPVFTELVTIIEEPAKEPENPHEAQVQEDTEDADRWRRRTRRTKGAAVPPPIPDRVGRPPPTAEEEAQLLPTTTTSRADEDHTFRFTYTDGSRPTRKITHLYRDNKRVRVVDLDLRITSLAFKAAMHGFYFDKIQGKRLFLQPY